MGGGGGGGGGGQSRACVTLKDAVCPNVLGQLLLRPLVLDRGTSLESIEGCVSSLQLGFGVVGVVQGFGSIGATGMFKSLLKVIVLKSCILFESCCPNGCLRLGFIPVVWGSFGDVGLQL